MKSFVAMTNKRTKMRMRRTQKENKNMPTRLKVVSTLVVLRQISHLRDRFKFHDAAGDYTADTVASVVSGDGDGSTTTTLCLTISLREF